MLAFHHKSQNQQQAVGKSKGAALTGHLGKFSLVFGLTLAVNTTAKVSDAAELSLPAPGLVNCALKPSKCGYPDATNTGPTRGTVFTRVPQDKTSGNGWAWEPTFDRLRVFGAGAVLDSVEVHAQVVIDAPNVTVSNNKIIACNEYGIISIRAGRPGDGYNGDGARIYRNLIGCDGPIDQRSDRGISDVYGNAKGIRIWRNNIYNTSNGVSVEGEAVVRANYVHDLGHQPGDHHSGLSTHGTASKIVFDFNTVLLDQQAVSAPITVYSDFGPAKNVTITRNLVSGGAYCFLGGEGGSYAPALGNIVMQYNRLSRLYGTNRRCGDYGEVASYSPSQGEWANNVWDDSLKLVSR